MNTQEKFVEMMKKGDFGVLRQEIKNQFDSLSEVIVEKEGSYSHQFTFKVEDELVDNLQAAMKLEYFVDPNGKKVFQLDFNVYVDGTQNAQGEIYTYVKHKEKFDFVLQALNQVKVDLTQEFEDDFVKNKNAVTTTQPSLYLVNQTQMKALHYGYPYQTQEAFMELEDEFLALVNNEQFKKQQEEAKWFQKESAEKTEGLMLEIERFNWETAVNEALANNDLEKLSQLSKFAIEA